MPPTGYHFPGSPPSGASRMRTMYSGEPPAFRLSKSCAALSRCTAPALFLTTFFAFGAGLGGPNPFAIIRALATLAPTARRAGGGAPHAVHPRTAVASSNTENRRSTIAPTPRRRIRELKFTGLFRRVVSCNGTVPVLYHLHCSRWCYLVPPSSERLAMRAPGEELTLRPRTKPWLLSIWIELHELSCDFSPKPRHPGPLV